MKKEEFLDNNIYANGFRMVYRLLMLNVYFTVTTSPLLIVLSISALTLTNWFFFMLASLTFVPSCLAVLKSLDKMIEEKELEVTRDYVRFFGQGFKRSFCYGGLFSLLVMIAVVDLVFVTRFPWFKGLLPVFVLLILLASGWLINTLYFYTRNPEQSSRNLVRVASFYVLKKWYVSLINVVLLGLLISALALKPPVGFLILPSLLLGAIYWNCSKLHQVGDANVQP